MQASRPTGLRVNAHKKTESLPGGTSSGTSPSDIEMAVKADLEQEGGQLYNFHRVNSEVDVGSPQK